MPSGRTRGARDERATTLTPARSGPPMYKNLSFLRVRGVNGLFGNRLVFNYNGTLTKR